MNIAVDPLRSRAICDIAIIGAGPYGLAAAAELRNAGIAARIFGEPMSFWRGNMPDGMMLRSPWIATHFVHRQGLLLDDYYREAGLDIPKLLPLEKFIDYGLWFQRKVASDVDRRKVVRIEPHERGFQLMLEDGETAFARRVVIAAGLLGHEFRPPEFSGLPAALVSHSCEHRDSQRYRGKRVAVIGRGQSACESAALLHEAGADVEIISRGHLEWNADPEQRSSLRRSMRSMLGQHLIPPSQVGPFPYSWLNEAPGLVHHLPRSTRERVNEISLRPTAITWLRDRLKHIPMHGGQHIRAAERVGGGVALMLEGATRHFDHVLLATGYRTDVERMTLLEPKLRQRITRRGGLPVLNADFESSVSGLHFIGAAAVGSFGPLLRFIAGAGFAARRIARVTARNRLSRPVLVAALSPRDTAAATAGRD